MPVDPPPPVPGSLPRRLLDGRPDQLVREEPLLLDIAGQPLVTMRTPGRDADLAAGFLLGEGVIGEVDEIAGMTFAAGDAAARRADTLTVTLTRPPDAALRGRLQRTHEIRSSCGACGLADPHEILDGTPPLLSGVPRLSRTVLTQRTAELRRHQPLFDATGGCHGALLLAADGAVLGHGEDVGRHNALDKAIGMAARANAQLATAIAILSGRAGFDLVVKCLRVRIPVIVSVSAPSALAFDLCQAAGATLCGFARGDRLQVYCDGARLS